MHSYPLFNTERRLFQSLFCLCLYIERKMSVGRSLRSQVLTHYKKLIRTAQAVFQDDPVRIASELMNIHDDI